MNTSRKSTLQITTFPGLAEILAAEVAGLGFKVEGSRKTSVELSGSLLDAMYLNLHLRTALSVMYLLREFKAETADDVYREVKGLPWEDVIPEGEYVTVVSRTETPAITNTMYANVRVKDAIVDRMSEKTGQRPDSGPERDHIVVNFFWRDKRAWIYVNTTGQKLSDRNYRKMPHKAPLREALAAGIMLTTGYSGEEPLVLPMCGSGTLAIEAALIALGKAPGLLRSNYGFMHLAGFDSEAWQTMRRETLSAAKKKLGAPIIATDMDPAAIKAAKQNAKTAGVDHLIDFHVCDFAETPVPEEGGIIVMNPEYGQRLGDARRLEETYKRIGDWFKKSCPGYTAYVLTANKELTKKIGLKSSRRTPFWNGKIECRLMKYEMYSGTRRG